jgi:CHAT domain-containing protein
MILDWLGAELYTEPASARQQLVASQSTYQDVALSLAQLPDAGAAGSEMAASALLHFKLLAVEEDAYLARLARRSEDAQIRAVASELQNLHAEMARRFQGGASAQEVTDVTARMEAKRLELGRVSGNYATLLQLRTYNLQDLRLKLPEQSALLEMRLYHKVDFKTGTLGPASWAGVLITPGGDIRVRDLGPTEQTDLSVKTMLAGSPNAAVALYQQLLAPFAADLAGLQRLYVAPDDVLYLVPFGLLHATDGNLVMDRLDLRLVQTGRDLLRPASDKPAKGLVAIGGIDFDLTPTAASVVATGTAQAYPIGDRTRRTRDDTIARFRSGFGALVHSKEEVEAVADLYRGARRDETVAVVEAGTPTKAWLLRLPPPRVLHLATHGFYRAPKEPWDHPMLLAGIALAGANHALNDGSDGGILYALEALDLNLEGTELVVLSACETAEGHIDYGEGVSGLVRALRTAGARNVLVTLRPVGDRDTRLFMERFYRHWLGDAQGDPAAALRQTQKDYLAQEAPPAPASVKPTDTATSATTAATPVPRGQSPLNTRRQTLDPTWTSFILVGN